MASDGDSSRFWLTRTHKRNRSWICYHVRPDATVENNGTQFSIWENRWAAFATRNLHIVCIGLR